MNTLRSLIKDAIDIHVHIGPEIIPRRYTVRSLVSSERGKIAGAVLKNHFYPTTPFITEAGKSAVKLFGGIVLNNSVGGLNAEAIYAASLLSKSRLLVWLPTINAQQFLAHSTYEIAPEWVQKKDFIARSVQSVSPVIVTKNCRLTPEAVKVLTTIKHTGSVLATGHIGWNESLLVVQKALEIGVRGIVITHPIYQRISMPVTTQKKLAAMGCFMEQSYSMYSIDKIPIGEIASQIKYVGAESVILSSDVGQPFSPPPSEALFLFASLLNKEGIRLEELAQMLVKNPKKLLGLKE